MGKSTLVKNFLGYQIIKNPDGIVIVKDGCNPMPGACVFSSLDDAKRSVIKLFMLAHADTFGGALYWRIAGRGGAYNEWFTFKKFVENLGMKIPKNVGPVDGFDILIGYKGEVI